MLRSRKTRREQPLDVHVPDPIVDSADGTDPEHEALLADSVGLALLVVLETLTPAERLAFVLHDMFAVPFERDRDDRRALARRGSAARQPRPPPRPRYGARPRRGPRPPAGGRRRLPRRRARGRLRRAGRRARPRRRAPRRRRRRPGGSRARCAAARAVARPGAHVRAARPGLCRPRAHQRRRRDASSLRDGRPFSVGAFTVRNGRIVEIDILADPERLSRLDLTILGE